MDEPTEGKTAHQRERPLPFSDLGDDMPLLPARMVNEHAYCPLLAYLEWVQGEWASSADTTEGKRAHRCTQPLATGLAHSCRTVPIDSPIQCPCSAHSPGTCCLQSGSGRRYSPWGAAVRIARGACTAGARDPVSR